MWQKLVAKKNKNNCISSNACLTLVVYVEKYTLQNVSILCIFHNTQASRLMIPFFPIYCIIVCNNHNRTFSPNRAALESTLDKLAPSDVLST